VLEDFDERCGGMVNIVLVPAFHEIAQGAAHGEMFGVGTGREGAVIGIDCGMGDIIHLGFDGIETEEFGVLVGVVLVGFVLVPCELLLHVGGLQLIFRLEFCRYHTMHVAVAALGEFNDRDDGGDDQYDSCGVGPSLAAPPFGIFGVVRV